MSVVVAVDIVLISSLVVVSGTLEVVASGSVVVSLEVVTSGSTLEVATSGSVVVGLVVTSGSVVKSNEPAYYKYILYIDKYINRNDLKEYLQRRKGIQLSGEVYKLPCHREEVFRNDSRVLNLKEKFPNSDFFANNHICLPIYPGLSDEKIDYIVTSLRSYKEEYIEV